MAKSSTGDFKWCPNCGCSEALVTSRKVNDEGAIIFCPVEQTYYKYERIKEGKKE